MKTRLMVLGVVFALLVSLGVGTSPAQAAVSEGSLVVESYTLTCSSIQITGTSSGPDVGIGAWWWDGTGTYLYGNGDNFSVTNGHFSGQVSFPAAPTGTWIEFGVEAWDGWWGESRQCPASWALAAAFSGPGIPAGFVLKTITCDVAVYDAPGGNPVGSNAIKAGQTWYVNPTPKKDAAGKSWTEIFVAGFTNGFVPTSCVH